MHEERPLLADLLAHRQFLAQVALRLTGERESADDLVQDAWLRVLARPPRDRSNLPAWLQRVLRHLHFHRARREVRYRPLEQEPLLPAAEDPPEDLGAVEVSRQVAALTLQLDEPYRTVLLLRFYEGLTPTRIAARLGRPVNTVTSQLARGLERLRAGLDRQNGGDARRWMGALAPLALSGARVDPATERAAYAAAGRGGRAVAFVRHTVLAGGLVAVLLTLVDLRRPSSEEGLPPTARASARPADAPPVVTTAGARARGGSGERLGGPVPAPVVAAQAVAQALELEVVDPDGAVLHGASLFVTLRSATPQYGDLVTRDGTDVLTVWREVARSDEHGRVQALLGVENAAPFRTEGAGELVGLLVGKPGFVRSPAHYFAFPPERRAPIRVTLERQSLVVRGRVVDADGHPVRALVFLSEEERSLEEQDGYALTHRPMGRLTDEAGGFEYADMAAREYRVEIRADGFVPRVDWVDRLAPVVDRDFTLSRGSSVYGRATNADGTPAAGALVQAQYYLPRLRPVTQRTTAGADGTFELSGLAPGLVHLLARQAGDPRSAAEFLHVTEEPGRYPWSPELDVRPPLRIRIVTQDGEPVAGAGLRLYTESAKLWWARFASDEHGTLAGPGLPAVEYLADVFSSLADVTGGGLPLLARARIPVGEETTLVLPQDGFALLEGRVLAGADLRVREQLVCMASIHHSILSSVLVDPDSGAFSKLIPAGTYQAFLHVERLGVVALDEFEARAGQTVDLGDILVPEASTLEVDWRWPGEDAQYAYRVIQLQDGAYSTGRWEVCTGQGRVPAPIPLLPGRFEWSVTRGGEVLERRELEIPPATVHLLTTGP